MQSTRSFLMVVLCVFLLPATALGSTGITPKILLHLTAPTSKGACSTSRLPSDCGSVVTAGGLYPQTYFAYLVVTDGDSSAGIAGVQFGVAYDSTAQAGIDVYSWNNCASAEFPSSGWPSANTGTLLTWDVGAACQRTEPAGSGTGAMAIAGYFYCAAYSADTLRITRRPVDDVAKVVDCLSEEHIVDAEGFTPVPNHLGYAVFSTSGTADGHNPCGLDPDVAPYEPTTVIVEYKPGILALPTGETGALLDQVTFTPSAAGTILEQQNVLRVDRLLPEFESRFLSAWGESIDAAVDMSNVYILTLADTSVAASVTAIQADSCVVICEPNFTRMAQFYPLESYTQRQWYLSVNANDHVNASPGVDIEAPLAWDIMLANDPQPVRVGVIDTGLELDHGDFDDFVEGPDYVNPGTSPADDNNAFFIQAHGTALSGIIGARQNGTGIVGVDFNSTLIPIKAADQDAQFTTQRILNAVTWAYQNQVRVACLASAGNSHSVTESNVFKNAQHSGMLLVVPMGNEQTTAARYPAAYKNFTFAVGATNWRAGIQWRDNVDMTSLVGCGFETAPFVLAGTNTGNWIDVSAPGGRFITTDRFKLAFDPARCFVHEENCSSGPINLGFAPNNEPQYAAGTSVSCAVTTGVASLVYSIRPTLTGEDVEEILRRTTGSITGVSEGFHNETGWGRVNARKALQYVTTPNQIQQGLVSDLEDVATISGLMYFEGVPGLPTNGLYSTTRHEMVGDVEFENSFSGPPDAWTKSYMSRGWSGIVPRYDTDKTKSEAEIVDGSLTGTGCQLRTYVYRIFVPAVGYRWFPCAPEEAKISWTAIGESATTGVSESGSGSSGPYISAVPSISGNRVRFSILLPHQGDVTLKVFDVTGRLTRTVMNSVSAAGVHEVDWDVRNEQGGTVASGVYLYDLRTLDGRRTGRVLVTR